MTTKTLLTIAVLLTGALVVAAFVVTHPQDPVLPHVLVVYDGEKGDLSYADSAYRGLFVAQESYRFTKQEIHSPDETAIRSLLDKKTGRRPGLVITISSSFADSTRRLATDYPGVLFLGVDQRGAGPANLQTCEITSYGESYLAGVLAATASKSGRVGIILGTQSELLEAFRQGYRDGARAKNPSIVVDEAYIRDNSNEGWTDPDRAGAIAREMYGNGADVIYTVAGFSGTGAIAEAKKEPGRYIIGVDSDQTHLGPSVILASAVKRLDQVVENGIGACLDGTFAGAERTVGLKEGATALVYNPKFSFYNETVGTWTQKAMAEEERYLELRKGTGTGT
jgi:basic membrane protein A